MKRSHIWVAIGLLSVGLWASHQLSRFKEGTHAARWALHLQDFPDRLGQWNSLADMEMESDVLAVLGLDDWLMRQYQDERSRRVLFYIGYLDSWSGNKKRQTVHSPQFCYVGGGWEIVEKETIQVPVMDGASIPITRMLVQKGMHQQQVLYWYQWGGEVAAEENVWDYGEKISWALQLPFRLARDERTDRALVRISSSVVGGRDETLQQAVGFVQAVFPIMAEWFSLKVSASQPENRSGFAWLATTEGHR